MDRACQDFLAGTALAEQHRRDVGRSHLLDGAAELEHRSVAGQESVQRRTGQSGSVARFQPPDTSGPEAQVEVLSGLRTRTLLVIVTEPGVGYRWLG